MDKNDNRTPIHDSVRDDLVDRLWPTATEAAEVSPTTRLPHLEAAIDAPDGQERPS